MAAKRKVVIKDHFIRSLIKETASLYEGNALSGGQIATFHENTDIIAHNCDISGYPKLSADKQSLVRNAIRPDNGVIDYETLVKEINSIIDKQIDPKKASVIFRLHTDHETAVTIAEELHIGDELKIITVDEYLPMLERSHNVVTQKKHVTGFWEYIKNGTWCELSNHNRNFRLATNTAVSRIEVARSLLNYFLDWKRVHYQSGPQPMAEVPPSRYFFEIYEREVVWWKYSLGDFKYLDKNIDPKACSTIVEECNKIYAMKDTKLKESIISSIMLLNEAMGCSRYDQMFILLWTIVDVLIPQIDCNETLLANVFRKGREKRRRTIKMLHDKRNVLVHQGDSSFIDENSVNQLKLIVETLIDFCTYVSTVAKTTDDIVFLLSKLESKDTITSEISLLSFAEKLYENE